MTCSVNIQTNENTHSNTGSYIITHLSWQQEVIKAFWDVLVEVLYLPLIPVQTGTSQCAWWVLLSADPFLAVGPACVDCLVQGVFGWMRAHSVESISVGPCGSCNHRVEGESCMKQNLSWGSSPPPCDDSVSVYTMCTTLWLLKDPSLNCSQAGPRGNKSALGQIKRVLRLHRSRQPYQFLATHVNVLSDDLLIITGWEM